jgi:tetratricopeptide (TPR) repeat protein
MRVRIIKIVIGVTLLIEPAFGASRKDHADCRQGDGRVRIAACTRVVNDLTESADTRAKAYFWRGLEQSAREQTIADYSHAIRLNPNYVEAILRRGGQWSEKGDPDRAIADFNRAIELRPDSEAYSARGWAWVSKKDYDRAIADFDQMIRLDPRDYAGYLHRAHVWNDKGDHERAIADYDEVIRLRPDNADFYQRRGQVRLEKGDPDGAIADFGQAIRLSPDVHLYYYWRGQAWFAKVDYNRAIADFNQATKLEPSSWLSVHQRADAYLLTGQFDRAIADYNVAIRGDSVFHPFGFYGRGIAKLRKGDKAGGNADIAKAIALGDWIAEEFASRGIKPDGNVPPPKPSTAVTGASSTPENCTAAETHWKSAETIGSLAVYEDHLKRFPNCSFATLAKIRVDALKK